MAKKRRRKIWLYILAALLLAILAFIIYFNLATRIIPPTELDPGAMACERIEAEPGLLSCGAGWLNQNAYGLWELYVEGDPLELGIMNGALTRELIEEQEDAFVDQIRLMIPSPSYLKFLKYFLAWFNKDLDSHIRQEYLLEIYGISAFASGNYDFIGNNYDRILNYHAAHDIGHALQNMNLVECTAFGVWDGRSSDSSLLVGRNFDFYVGDAFAENKIIAFVRPTQGYAFASITWAGMIGVVSGMNEKGLCLTLNSAKSDIPFGARTPVSIIAREILQYASNIEEAYEIASARSSFVSESFLIGSAADHRVVVIEKSTDKTAIYDPDTNFIILTNHFQSDALAGDRLNLENMANETSVYRLERVQELLDRHPVISPVTASAILRDRKGKGGRDIGNGNEKAINQLIAHHSVIFRPEQRQVWISTAPWQLGAYLCYDLDSVFGYHGRRSADPIFIGANIIPPDTFLNSSEFDDFMHYRQWAKTFQDATGSGTQLEEEETAVSLFIASNPSFYQVYYLIGKYYQNQGFCDKAMKYYKLALENEIGSADERKQIGDKIQECSHE
jgi:hypothetical protein